MNEQTKKPIYKKWWFWALIVVVVVIIIGIASSGGESSTNNQVQTQTETEKKDKLTLDEGWVLEADDSPYIKWKHVRGTVSNNTDKDISNYIQITFNAFDEDGNNIGTCLANTNTVSANGKWKFDATCLDEGVARVEMKEITGY